MLGGGVFITQNKKLPGAYINFVNASTITTTFGERGVVAIPYSLKKDAGSVIQITASEFLKNSNEILGIAYDSKAALPFREIFCHANKCVIYDLGNDKTAADAISALEPYSFNVLAVYTDDEADVLAYINAVKTWRDNGKKCQAVVFKAKTAPNHEGIINLETNVVLSDETLGIIGYGLVAWVAGAEAGCELNESCTNMLHDGELEFFANKTQIELEEYITQGKFAFHNVYGEIRVLEDINSLTTTTADKGDDFKSNQTIRVLDQIANDIARLFNTKYLGRIPNNASGRVSLWGDIIAHHRQLETNQVIENFDATLVTVEKGESKKSVVVNDVITPVNAMAQLYMTIVVQ